MHTNLLTAAVGLSDNDLLARLQLLASRERETCAELVAHLAVLDTRPTLYAADGFGSLFAYCTEALHLSEDAACNRIEAARACRRFPRILALLASGTLSLTAVRLIGRHLTAENHETVLARASQKSRREIEALVAEVAPRPDAPSCVRKLPVHAAPAPGRSVLRLEVPSGARPVTAAVPEASLAPPPRPAPPPVEALAPERYRVQFTIGAETREKLARLQALLRREIPDGDPGVIFDRAISLLLDQVERKKLGKAARPCAQRAIRPGTDNGTGSDPDASEGALPPRDPLNAVKRAVWARDGGRCAYIAPSGRRCTQRTFLEFHHVQPYAMRGEPTVENIALRCRLHNQYEAVVMFGGARRPGAAPHLIGAPRT